MRPTSYRGSRALLVTGCGLGLVLATGLFAACGDDDPFGPGSDFVIAFVEQPVGTPARQVLPPVVAAIQDAAGTTVESATLPVTVALGQSPSGATLSGTLTVSAVAGVATFNDLRIDEPGSGYTLVASAGSLPEATSDPFEVAFVSPLAVGVEHACMLASTGEAYCWGRNDYGQLGDGTTANRTTPVSTASGLAFASLTGGIVHTCGLSGTGEAYCWGRNNVGQLGDSSRTQRLSPVPVGGAHRFTALAAGWDHTCSVTSDRDVYCWGYNNAGQLGDGTRVARTVPTPTFGTSLLDFSSARAGGRHSCGLAPDGVAYCWGLNDHGQLGDGTKTQRFVPTAVSGNDGFRSVATNDHPSWETTCAVSRAGEAHCWGLNNYGQLGGGTTGGDASEPTRVFGGLVFASVSPGQDHTCGVTATGEAYCWGRNHLGQLGNGDAGADAGTNTPTLVPGGLTFRYVGTGNAFSCGVTTSDEVYCWGWNGRGQLGNGTTTDSSLPVAVEGLP